MSEPDTPFPTEPEGSEATDRRTLTRHSCRLEGVCDSVVGSELVSHPAVILEISATGAALLLADRLEPGAVVTVRLSIDSEKVSFTKLARVVHVRLDSGGWWLGTLFLKPLRPEEIDWLLRRQSQQTSPLFFEI